MARQNDHTAAGTLTGMYSDIEILKRRTARILPERLFPGGYDSATSYRGTTAERDAIYGVPATTAERVALANRGISWFNTDLGWEESYYAPTGSAGLTAPGLVAAAAAGWYPTGLGPFQRLQPTAAFGATAGNPVRSWMGTRYRKGGDSWFTYTDANGRVQIKVAGYYRLQVWTTQQSGSGAANYHLRQLNAGVTEQHVDGLAFTLNASLLTHPAADADMLILANRELDFFLHTGALSVHQGGGTTIKGEFTVTYFAPPLASD